jgi:hypothetical protein
MLLVKAAMHRSNRSDENMKTKKRKNENGHYY